MADCFCTGNDDDGYKTTMPYVLTATHTGWSKAFGAPSGRAVKYHGIANCFIKRNGAGQWQYTREWDLPDMWAFTTALNLSASQLPPPKRRPRARRPVRAALRVGHGVHELVPTTERVMAQRCVRAFPLSRRAQSRPSCATDLSRCD